MKTAKTPLPVTIAALSTDTIKVTGEVKGDRVYVRLRDSECAAEFPATYKRQRAVMDRVVAALSATHSPRRDGFRGSYESPALYCFFDRCAEAKP